MYWLIQQTNDQMLVALFKQTVVGTRLPPSGIKGSKLVEIFNIFVQIGVVGLSGVLSFKCSSIARVS